MLPLSRESFLELGSHHRVDVSLWTAESMTYDAEMASQCRVQEDRACALHAIDWESERGVDEHPVEV